MVAPIPSSRYPSEKGAPQWFRLPPIFGVQPAPWRMSEGFDWGMRHTIDYVIRLADAWGTADSLYGQIERHGNYAPLLLGDIAPLGGASSPLGQEMIRNKWHKSHNSGVDLDLFVLRKDGAAATSAVGGDGYDRERTTALAHAIYDVGGRLVQQVFFDDDKVIQALRRRGITTIGPDTGPVPTPHRDHLHVRLHPV